MPVAKRRNLVGLNVQMAKPLHRRLKEEAKLARRSLGAEIESRLTASLDRSWSLTPAEQPAPAAAGGVASTGIF